MVNLSRYSWLQCYNFLSNKDKNDSGQCQLPAADTLIYLNKHLKDVTLEEYCGSEREVEFARFIVGGAKALTALQIVVHAANWSDKSINSHNDLICRGGKASSEAQVNFRKSKKGKNKLRNSYSTVQRVPIV
jgi:hypothetical protein